MRILHIGSLTSQHTQIAALAYLEMGYEAVFLNTRKQKAFFHVPGVPEANNVTNPWSQSDPRVPRKRFGNSLGASVVLALRYLGSRDKHLVGAIQSLAVKKSLDVVVGTWGLPVLEAMLCAQEILSATPFVHHILTIPDLPVRRQGWRGACWKLYSRWFWTVERRAYRVMLSKCDVRVHCNGNMLKFVKTMIRPIGMGIDVIRLERFNRRFFGKHRHAKLSSADGEPHVVHIGATNFSGQSIDDMGNAFAEMAEARVHVHFSHDDLAPMEARESLPYYHVFPQFPSDVIDGRLAEFCTQFDAIVILYNVDRAYERFENSLPTRFLFALVVGIPIAMPEGLFPACEEYVRQWNIGFTYKSGEHLAALLSDRSLLLRLAANALAHSQEVSVEDNLTEYQAILQTARDISRARVEGNNQRTYQSRKVNEAHR